MTDIESPVMDAVETGGNLKGRIEAILYVCGEAVALNDLAAALRVDRPELDRALDELRDEYDFAQRGFRLYRFGTKVQLTTRKLYSEDIVRLLQPVQKQSLRQSVMETLAVVAYKQPVTKAEIEALRGVKCDYSLQSLMTKGLIEEKGRKDTVGHPILYGTTESFLQHFAIGSLEELPPLPAADGDKTGNDPVPELVP